MYIEMQLLLLLTYKTSALNISEFCAPLGQKLKIDDWKIKMETT